MKTISKIFFLAIVSTFIFACNESPERTKAASEKVEGSVKETVGNATNDKSLKNEGKIARTKGDLRSTKEDVKDIVTGK